MLDSDCINFMVGAKINQAHYDPNMPIEIEIRKNIIKKIEKVLSTRYMKKVTVKYMWEVKKWKKSKLKYV